MVYNQSFSKGRVSVTQWNNTAKGTNGDDDREFQTYSIQKSYKNDKGEWVNSSTFTESELKDVVLVIGEMLSTTVKKRGETTKE